MSKMIHKRPVLPSGKHHHMPKLLVRPILETPLILIKRLIVAYMQEIL